MHFEFKLVNIWVHLVLTTIICSTLFISVMFIWHPTKSVSILLGFPIFFGSMILSALLSSSKKSIDLNNGILTLNKKTVLHVDQIKWYNQEVNFLFDGFRLKTINNKNHCFMITNLFHRNQEFVVFKEMLFKNSANGNIPEKKTQQLYKENKSLRHLATGAMCLYIIVITLVIFTDFKIDTEKLLYTGPIIIGAFISTRK